MKPKTILNISGGIDVVTPETELADNVARSVENVVIHNDGGFDLRPGATKVLDLDGVRQLWATKDGSRAFATTAQTLYALTWPAEANAIADVWRTTPVVFAEGFGSVYMADDVIYRITDDGVVAAGVADLRGTEPTLSAAPGSLVAERYGFAFSAVDAAGQESGLSDIAWIDLETDGGVQLGLPASAGAATRYRIYRTTANGGDDLRLCDTIAVASSHTITGGEVGRLARNRYLAPLPAGTQLFEYRGRMYSAVDSFLFCSEPLNPELHDAREGFIGMPGPIRMAAPVENGIFIGTDTDILFLSGSSPRDFKLEHAAGNGAFEQRAVVAPASYFNPKLVDTAREVVMWVSGNGYQIGLPGGTVVSPQEGKVRLSDVGQAETLVFMVDGVKQIVSAMEAMTLGNGGATDTTP